MMFALYIYIMSGFAYSDVVNMHQSIYVAWNVQIVLGGSRKHVGSVFLVDEEGDNVCHDVKKPF
ncbi:unnamed protein product [Ectocarpus sp. 12 AP-2014]